MKKVITYGTYDLLHQGHINLLKRAKALGDFLIVGVTGDGFDLERGKLNVRNNVLERVEAVRETGIADKIIIEEYVGQKIDDIQKYGVDIFTIGSDWQGKFDYLNEFCKVEYLPRTEGISSTLLRQNQFQCRVGIIGTGRIAKRFISESEFVNGMDVLSAYNPINTEAFNFAKEHKITNVFTNFESFLESIDAVYVASPHLSHYEYCLKSLNAGKHVLCEIPLVLSGSEARELYNIAEKNGVMLMEASKTAFCPAFKRLVTIVKSGIIGEVVDVEASISKLVSSDSRILDKFQAGGSMNELGPLPIMAIIKLLGKNYKTCKFYSKFENDVDIYTKGIIEYEKAIATVKLGLGIKTEGNLIVSGTKGYIYVPSPWWLTSYFEIRFEDQNNNKKLFYSFDGDGLRYEIQNFLSCIANNQISTYILRRKESIAIAEIIELYRKGDSVSKLS